MDIINNPETMQQCALRLRREGRIIAFVPTMGFLHEGHLSLMRIARQQCDVLVVSIFVNPTQFGPNEDLDAYPRDFDRDEKLCATEQVNYLFYPTPDSMYAEDSSVWVDEESLSNVLCGFSRPGHFRGVCTVVAKLFNLVQPDLAVFGEKDAQQLRIIERMVRDLNFPVRIVRGPIVREVDGLAMSSRNKYLTAAQRKNALCLKEVLDQTRDSVREGELDTSRLVQAAFDRIASVPEATVDYVSFVDDETLLPVDLIRKPVLMALAVKIGSTRLIDNTVLEP